MELQKVISGGQTGVDQIALFVASLLGYATGGRCPAHYMTSAGPDKRLMKYGLEPLVSEGSLSSQYIRRSILNVTNSDATLAFLLYESAGTAKTVGYCLTGNWSNPELPQGPVEWTEFSSVPHPCFIVRSLENPDVTADAIRYFLISNRIKTLNVCGHRFSQRLKRYETRIKELLQQALAPSAEEDTSSPEPDYPNI